MVLLTLCSVSNAQDIKVGGGIHSVGTSVNSFLVAGIGSNNRCVDLEFMVSQYDGDNNTWNRPHHPFEGNNLSIYGSQKLYDIIYFTVGYHMGNSYKIGFSFMTPDVTLKFLYEPDIDMTKNYVGLSLDIHHIWR
jgi:hypothetical protein